MTYVCPTEKHKNRFKDHEMSIIQNGWVKFAKPGTNIDMLCFNTFYGYLTVIGDLGDAVYQWNERITLDWVADCNLSYFLEKCQASEVGRDFEQWSESDCEADLEQWWNEHLDDLENEEERERWIDLHLEDKNEALSIIYEGRHFWEHWLYEKGHELFGDEWWDFAGKFGVKPHIRSVLHLAALKVMKEKKDAEAALRQA